MSLHLHRLLTDVAPTAKAIPFVREVIVIDVPACRNVIPIFSGIPLRLSSVDKFFQAAMMTNRSSTPIPNSMKGRHECMGPYGMPAMEQMLTATAKAIIIPAIPTVAR